jgi:hypothetical protein
MNLIWNETRTDPFMPVYGEDITYGNAAGLLAGMIGMPVQAVLHSAYGSEGTVNDQYTTADGQTALMLNDPSSPSPYDSGSWNQLKSLLSESDAHNFVYFGHGAVDFIGMKSRYKITSADVAAMLTNNLSGGIQTLYGPQQHPYRFVFLDGCNTARGNLPLAFGIPNKVVSDDDWNNKYHLQPRAFLGWSGYTAWSLGLVKNDPSVMDATRQQSTVQFWHLWSGYDPDSDSFDPAQSLQDAKDIIHAATYFAPNVTLYGDPDLPFYQ